MLTSTQIEDTATIGEGSRMEEGSVVGKGAVAVIACPKEP